MASARTAEELPVHPVQSDNDVGFVLGHGVPTVLFSSASQGAAWPGARAAAGPPSPSTRTAT